MSVEGAAGRALPAYRARIARRLAWLAAAAAAAGLLALGDVLTGPARLDLGAVVWALAAQAGADARVVTIVWDIRLPMTLMAMVVGAALSVAGAAMQTLLGNPLASPYTLGFSAAAGFGAALALLLGVSLPWLPWLTVPVAAFVGTALAALLVYGLSRLRAMTAETMVLAGIATLFLFQSAQSLVQYLAAPEVLRAIVFWLFGALLKASWDNLPISAGILALGVAALAPVVWQLTALRLGDARAAALGVDVRRLRLRVFAIVALLTAGAVSFVGTIGFIGLVAPHIARMLVGDEQRFLLPMAGLTGAGLLTGASILSKVLAPGLVIPIGIVTAVIGVPFLLALIVRRGRRYW